MKILIIGQAPPAVKQQIPYDTTMLYSIFEWVGISKEEAQKLFDFEAVSNKFPGHGDNGHLTPSLEDMNKHYRETLRMKIANSKKVIILGNVAKAYLQNKGIWLMKSPEEIICLIHPSKRNTSKIMDTKNVITQKLKTFLTQ